jgi:glycosyltransferase involved in cell wall biosynthesis
VSKIIVNTRFLLPDKLEGIGWFTYEVLKRWVKWHPEHEFIFVFDRKFDEQFVFGTNVTPLTVFPQARHPLLFYWWFEWSLPAVFRKHKPDVFVSPDGFLSLSTDIPTLLVIHDIAWKHFPDQIPWSHRKHYENFMPRFAKKATRIATVSDYSKKDIIDFLNIPEEKIDVVYDGSNEAFLPLSLEEKVKIEDKYSQGCPYFLYVGSIHPRKNVTRLLQAFEQFKSKSSNTLKLVLAGRIAWQSGEIASVLASMQHKDDVIFLGYTAPEELHKIVASAFALTYVSLFEGFGIPILEAMYCDVPSITSSTSSMPEVAGNAGLLADPYSVDSICLQMLRLYNERGLRESLVQLGKEQRLKFSWDLTAEKMWKINSKILSK